MSIKKKKKRHSVAVEKSLLEKMPWIENYPLSDVLTFYLRKKICYKT